MHLIHFMKLWCAFPFAGWRPFYRIYVVFQVGDLDEVKCVRYAPDIFYEVGVVVLFQVGDLIHFMKFM